MRGRNVFMDSLVGHGVEYIFGNPGTTESPLIDSLADYPDLNYVVALHEGVAVGAAGHYAQASGKTGIVNLHVAPGLGNGIGMLYSAYKANSPMIVTAGQQDTRIRLDEPVLGHDLVAMAAPVTKWSVQVERADEMAPILRRAFKIAHEAPSGPVFVALPIDVMEGETTAGALGPDRLYDQTAADPDGVEELARLLLAAQAPAIIAGDQVARSGAGAALVRLAEAIGADVWHELLHMQAAFPSGHASARGPLPGDARGIAKALSDADVVLLIGGGFFDDVWYAPGRHFAGSAKVAQIEESAATLAHKQHLDLGLVGNLRVALEAVGDGIARLATAPERVAAADRNAHLADRKRGEIDAQQGRAERSWQRQPPSMARVMAELQAAAPADVIIVDESITASIDLARTLEIGGPGDYFGARGGGIGQGIAGALGVKVAAPDRPVMTISGDGSAMYSIQALWTAAHHDLAIVFVILANQEYRVLKHNLDAYRQRFEVPSNNPYVNMDLTAPSLDFAALAEGMGVGATRVATGDDLGPALRTAFAAGKPHLVQVAIEGKV